MTSGPARPAPPEENTWFNQRPPPRNLTPGRIHGEFSRRRRFQLTTDSPSLRSESNSRAGSVASGHSKSSMSSRRSRLKRKRLHRDGTHTGTHIRFDSSDEGGPNTCDDSRSTYQRPRTPTRREFSEDNDAVDLDAISLPSRLGSRSASLDEPPQIHPDSSLSRARCSTYDSSASLERLSVATSRPDVKGHSLENEDDEPSDVDSHSRRKRRCKRQSLQAQASKASDSEHSLTRESRRRGWSHYSHTAAHQFLHSPPASTSTLSHSTSPTTSNEDGASSAVEAYADRTPPRQTIHSCSAGRSSTSHHIEPTTPTDEGNGSAADVRSVRTTVSAARRHSSMFDSTAPSDSLHAFLEHAQKINRRPAFDSTHLGPDGAGPSSSRTERHPYSTHPSKPTWSAGNSISTMGADPPHSTPFLLQTSALGRAHEPRAANPRAGPPTPGRIPTPGGSPAPTRGRPTGTPVAVTWSLDSARTPLLPSRSKMASMATQTDAFIADRSHHHANWSAHATPPAGASVKSCGIHNNPCTICACAVSNIFASLLHWAHRDEWFSCECEK